MKKEVKRTIILYSKLWVGFTCLTVLLSACSMRESDTSRIQNLARKGNSHAMLAVVTNYDNYFKETISDEEWQSFCDTLLNRGESLAYNVVIKKEFDAYMKSLPPMTRSERRTIYTDARDSISLKWWHVGIEHGCTSFYDEIAHYYHRRFKKTGDPADSIAEVKYKTAGIAATRFIKPDENTPWGVIRGGLRSAWNEIRTSHEGTFLQRITATCYNISFPMAASWSEQLFQKATWWQALIAIILFLIPFALMCVFIPYPVRKHTNYKGGMKIAAFYALYNISLISISISSDYIDYAYSLRSGIGAFFYPEAAFGWSPYFGIVATWFIMLLLLIRCFVETSSCTGRRLKEFGKTLLRIVYIFIATYIIVSLAGHILLLLIQGVFAIVVLIFICVVLIFSIPGFWGAAVKGMFNPFASSSSVSRPSHTSGYSGPSYTSGHSSSEDDTTNTSSSEYDTVIRHGGTFGEDIEARQNVDGSLTDRNGNRWTDDGYGHYSKE